MSHYYELKEFPTVLVLSFAESCLVNFDVMSHIQVWNNCRCCHYLPLFKALLPLTLILEQVKVQYEHMWAWFCDIRTLFWGKSARLTSVMWKPKTPPVVMWERTKPSVKKDTCSVKTLRFYSQNHLRFRWWKRTKADLKYMETDVDLSIKHNLTKNTNCHNGLSSISLLFIVCYSVPVSGSSLCTSVAQLKTNMIKLGILLL